jgi:hypothetical protein
VALKLVILRLLAVIRFEREPGGRQTGLRLVGGIHQGTLVARPNRPVTFDRILYFGVGGGRARREVSSLCIRELIAGGLLARIEPYVKMRDECG